MRTALGVTLALALCGPIAAHAADTSASNDVRGLVGAYQHVKSVQVIERFENGVVATVDVMPSGQYRVATTGGEQDPALILKIATQPADGADYKANYSMMRAGSKTIDGARTNGVRVIAPDGTYDATFWLNDYHLPVSGHVIAQGHSVDLTYGNYNRSALVSKP